MINMATKIKTDLKEEYQGIKYILTSTMRTKLLLSIYNDPKNLDELREELKKPSATILHGLKELENMNYVKKVQKQYQLTSNGYLLTTNMVKLIDNWYATNKNEDFWNIHDLTIIPKENLKNIYLLKNSKCISSTTSNLSKAYNSYSKLIENASELKITLPIFSENHLRQIVQLIKEESLQKLELIIHHEILPLIRRNPSFKQHLINNKNVKIISIKHPLKTFLTIGDDFMSLALFFKDGHYDDSQILIDKSPEGLKWGEILYHHTKEWRWNDEY